MLVYGDSLSTGYGMAIDDNWVTLLQARLRENAMDIEVINASISGETSHGAKVRIDRLLEKTTPAITIIELGGNDGLRGLSMDAMYSNLDYIINALHEAGSQILLIPMQLPPNYGPVYNDKLQDVYQRLAEVHDITIGRFILDGIAGQEELMQDDGIHPQEEAQQKMLENVWSDLEPLLKKHL